MVNGVNHIGIVVENIDRAFALWERAYGAKLHGKKEFPEAGQISALVSIGDTCFEFMEPLGDVGVVPKFFSKRGEGLHHISIRTDNIDSDCKKFEEEGLQVLFHDENGGFISPKGNLGVVFEVSLGDEV